MIGFLDIETGGFSITKNGVCEIAVCAFDENQKHVATFHKYIKPYERLHSTELVSYKDDAMKVNGISMEQLENGEEVSEVMLQLMDFITEHKIDTLIGHNSNVFDIPRIEYLMTRFTLHTISNLNKKDTLKIAKNKIALVSNKLEYLCEFFNVTNEKAHSAVSDTLATAQVYYQLMKL